MKRVIMKLLIFISAVMLVIFLQGKTEETDLTFKDAVESFAQYETTMQDFLAKPTKENLPKVNQFHKFHSDYFTLIDHQTMYNKVFGKEPLLSKSELEQLEGLYEESEKLDEQYVAAAFQHVYKASDFMALIDEARKKGEYASESIDIRKSNNHSFDIVIQGSFNMRDTDNLSRRYFIIETKHGNYYWLKPYNYSMSYTSRGLALKIEKDVYNIEGSILY